MERTWTAVVVALVLLVVATAAALAITDAPWHRGPAGSDGDGAGSSRLVAGAGHRGSAAQDEYDYLASMVPHHEEAIVAGRQLRRSDDPDMRELGARIVASQTAQVAQMEAWLAEWYPGLPASDPAYVPMMRDLTTLGSEQLDRAFLSDMIPHHMMAVMASQQVLARGGVEHDEVAALARSIRDEQRDEIHLMRRWLSRDDPGLSFGHHPGGMTP